jgi:ribosomal protein S12 methylthiotransferase
VQVQQRVSASFAAGLVGRQLDVLVDGVTEDGWLYGRTQYDAPDCDPIVFLSEPPGGFSAAEPPLEVGQMRRCLITSNSLFDLEAHPVA